MKRSLPSRPSTARHRRELFWRKNHGRQDRSERDELHFTEGVLEGLKLIGFSVWERRSGGGRNVTFPARQYAVNGERRWDAGRRPRDDVRR